MAWSDERVEKLKTLWAEGVTAAEIAKALGDVSRNAVIGKAHRLGLSNRAPALKSAEKKPEEPKDLDETSAKKTAASASRATPTTDTEPKPAAARAVEAESARKKEDAKPRVVASAEDAEDMDALETAEGDAEETLDGEDVNPIAALAAEAERTSRRLTLLELNERTCKWPIGDPSTDDFYFCGHPCAPDKPYCEAHVQVAYQPMSSRRDRERSRARAATA